MLTREAASWLEKSKEQLVERASKKIYNIIKSYRDGDFPAEESRETMMTTLVYIIAFLRDELDSVRYEEDLSTEGLIQFENGIASKRVVYNIKLEDLLHGIRIFRDEIWNLIASKLDDRQIRAPEFLKLEKRINVFINHMMARVAGTYNRNLARFIGIQSSDLEKWEEVIKSASNIELKIPCRGEFAAIARLQAEALARRLNYSEEEVHDIKVAVGEACDNAIEHGKSDKGIDIHYHLSAHDLRIEVIDYGCGFDPEGKGEEPPDPLAERGRGIFLMRVLMDKANIYSKPGEGCMTVLTKKRVYK